MDADQVLSDPLIELVSIASFDNYHYEHILKAIANRKHIFVEKPLCLYDFEFRNIITALSLNPEVKLSSNLVLRCAPHFLKLKERLEKGFLGKPYYIELAYNYGRIHKILNGWRGSMPYYSVMHGGGIHMIDLLLWLVGSEIKDVIATGNKIVTEFSDFKYPDMVTSLIRFHNGIIAKLTSNFGCVIPHHHGLTVYGTEATYIKIYKKETYYYSRNDDDRIEENDYIEEYPRYSILNSFISSLIDNTTAIVTKQDVISSMAVSLALEKSLMSSSWEEVLI
jgi:predicted dehydrogenase